MASLQAYLVRLYPSLLMLSAAVLVNKWSLGWLLAADKHIGNPVALIFIATAQAALIVAAVYLLLRREPLRLSPIYSVIPLLLTAVGSWGMVGYILNPPDDFSRPTFPRFDCSAIDLPCNSAAAMGLADLRRYGKGLAIVDFDGDGWEDIFITDADPREASDAGRSGFYRNTGDGRFEPVDMGIDDTDLISVWAVAFGDYDNDGDPDLLLAGGGYEGPGFVAFYENQVNEGRGFVRRTTEVGLDEINQQAYRWWGISWADYNNDGWLDAVLTRIQGDPVLLMNTGQRSFVNVTDAVGIDIGNSWRRDGKNSVWLDYDNDGDLDLYLAGIGSHFLFRNDAAGSVFTDVTAEVLDPIMPGNWLYQAGSPAVFAAVAFDFNQNGLDDLYLGRQVEQDLVLINEGGRFIALGREVGIDASLSGKRNLAKVHENTMGLGVGDINDDGWPDIVIGTGEPERAAADIIFCNRSGQRFERCSDYLSGNADRAWFTRAHGIAFGDLNNDGTTNLVLNLGGHALWDVDSGADSREFTAAFVAPAHPERRTATLILEGTRSNRDAIGARIKVMQEGGAVHYYVVRSAQGFQSQNSRSMLVALGKSERATVEVQWPAGGTTLQTVEAGQRLKIVEPHSVE